MSDVFDNGFQHFMFVWVFKPAGRPAGFDAGPVLQEFVVTRQLWVPLLAQPEQCRATGQCFEDVHRIIISLLSYLMLIIPSEEEKGDVGKDGHISQSEVFSRQETSTGLQNKANLRARF